MSQSERKLPTWTMQMACFLFCFSLKQTQLLFYKVFILTLCFASVLWLSGLIIVMFSTLLMIIDHSSDDSLRGTVQDLYTFAGFYSVVGRWSDESLFLTSCWLIGVVCSSQCWWGRKWRPLALTLEINQSKYQLVEADGHHWVQFCSRFLPVARCCSRETCCVSVNIKVWSEMWHEVTYVVN